MCQDYFQSVYLRPPRPRDVADFHLSPQGVQRLQEAMGMTARIRSSSIPGQAALGS